MVALARRGQWGLAANAVLLAAAALWMAGAREYAYGAYKLIVIDWWCLVLAAVVGAEALVRLAPGGPLRWGLGAAAALVLLAVPIQRHSDTASTAQYIDSPNRALSMSRYRELAGVRDIVGQNPVLIAVDDWVASEWAVYYLRDVPVQLAVLRMYLAMPHVVPLIQRAPPLDPAQIRYALTDATVDRARAPALGWKERWASPPYVLWERSR